MTSTITQADMDQLVADGHATRWTQPLGGVVPLAARVGDTWYVVHDTHNHDASVANGGERVYQRAPQQLAAVLSHASAVLDLADAAVAAADHAALTQGHRA